MCHTVHFGHIFSSAPTPFQFTHPAQLEPLVSSGDSVLCGHGAVRWVDVPAVPVAAPPHGGTPCGLTCPSSPHHLRPAPAGLHWRPLKAALRTPGVPAMAGPEGTFAVTDISVEEAPPPEGDVMGGVPLLEGLSHGHELWSRVVGENNRFHLLWKHASLQLPVWTPMN